MPSLVDYLFGKIAQHCEEKIKENPIYQKVMGFITISDNSELNKLLDESLKVAKKNYLIAELSDDEIIPTIDKNINAIFECIVFSKNQIPLSIFLMRLKYDNDNEEYIKRIEAFYKSLYEQLHTKKQNYPTLQNIQIQNELDNIKEEIKSGFYTTNESLQNISSDLVAFIEYTKDDHNKELSDIESKIENREFIIARSIAVAFEDKIIKRNNNDEIEKLYALIVNTYLLVKQYHENLPIYFEKLIFYTRDDKKKKARSILLQIIKKDYGNAQKELDFIFKNWNIEDVNLTFYENQINVYLLTGKYETGYNFISQHKNHINNYQYYLSLMLIHQGKIDEAYYLLEDNNDFFEKSEYDIQETKVIIKAHYLLRNIKQVTTIDGLSELKSLITEINALILKSGDNTVSKSYLHSINALIFAATFNKKESKREYEKALEIDPNNYNALKNYPYLLLDSDDDMKKGLELIKKYIEKYPDAFEEKSLYYAILTEINPKQVIKEISEQKIITPEVKVYLVHSFDNTLQSEKAEICLRELIELNQNNYHIQMCAGYHYLKTNDCFSAFSSFINAHALCKNENDYDSVFHNLLRIVCFLNDIEKMNIARSLLDEKYSIDLILIKYPRYYIYMLLVMNDYVNCISCCDKLKQLGHDNKYIIEAEMACYYNTRNFLKAKLLLDEYGADFGNDVLISMAHACARIGEYNLSKELIKRTKKPKSEREYIIKARLLFSIKEYLGSLETIHDAYINYPDDRDIQEFFILLVYGHHIVLSTEDMENSFGRCLNAYLKADYSNKILLGISVPKEASGQEILELIEKHLPNKSELSEKIELIRSSRYPISFYRSLFRKSLFSIYDMVIHSPNKEIWCTEQFGMDATHIQKSPLYIDLSSLITLDLLNLLSIVKKLFPMIYFTQSVLDEILVFDNELSQPYGGHVIINYERHNDYIKKPQEQVIVEMKERIQRLRIFVLSDENIQIKGMVLNPKKVASKRIEDFISNYKTVDVSESDTMSFGYQDDCQVMIESVVLRAAFNSFDKAPSCFGIDSLLKYLFEKEIISREKYILSLTLLFENNYRQIPISVEHLFFIIQYEGYTVSQKHERLFNIFASKEYNFDNTLAILSALLCLIWNDNVSEHKKSEWSDYLLDIVFLNPSMNYEYESEILSFVGKHIVTKQNGYFFYDYLKQRIKSIK